MRPTWLLSGCIATLLTLHAGATGAAAEDVKKTVLAGGVAGDTDEALRQILRDVIKIVTAPRKAKADAPETYTLSHLEVDQPTAEALLAIGTAQAMVGDREAARKTWRDANDRIDALPDYDSGQTKVGLLQRLADGQVESGERDEALATLRRASEVARSMRLSRDGFPMPPSPGDDDRAKQSAVFRLIAAAQAKAGDARAARKSFRQATEAAGAIKADDARVDALVEIAKADAPEAAREVWTRVTDFALSRKDVLRKCEATEAVLRGLVDSGSERDAMRLVSERLDGDLGAFGIWVVADALIGRKRPFQPDVAGQLAGLAVRARFDRPSKQMTVLIRVAMAQIKAGDDRGAFRTIGKFLPRTAEEREEMVLAKFGVMREVAKTQIREGKKNEARATLRAALETLAPLRGGDGGIFYRVEEIFPLMAKAGDSATALRIVGENPYARWRASTLVEIASVQADSGERDAALRTLELARRAIDGVVNDILWSELNMTIRLPPSRFRPGHKSARSLDLMSKHVAMHELAVGMARAGDVARALEIADAVAAEEAPPSRVWSGKAFAEIALIQSKAGDFAGAVKTADHIIDIQEYYLGHQKSEILKKIAESQAKSGDARDVLAWGRARNPLLAKLIVLQGMAEGIVARRIPKTGKDAAAPNTP